MNIALWVLQVLLAALYGFSGATKVFSYEQSKLMMPDLSQGLAAFIGASEMLGAAGLILPWLTGVQRRLTPLAAMGLAVVMLLALGYHVQRAQWSHLPMVLVLMGLNLFVAWGRWKSLKKG